MQSTGINAANSNSPLWQRVTLRVAAAPQELDSLSPAEQDALWEKAVATMKPSAAEREAMTADAAARKAYMLSFVNAYRAGMPPLAQYVENTHRHLSE